VSLKSKDDGWVVFVSVSVGDEEVVLHGVVKV